jgi:hypothetical protein
MAAVGQPYAPTNQSGAIPRKPSVLGGGGTPVCIGLHRADMSTHRVIPPINPWMTSKAFRELAGQRSAPMQEGAKLPIHGWR